MKAVLTQGSKRGVTVKVIQWCNDWFEVEVGCVTKIVSPSALAFSLDDMATILAHGNNGSLHREFKPKPIEINGYPVTFMRRTTRRSALWRQK